MFKNKLKLNISLETLKILGILTVIFTVIGFLFGRMVELVFLDTSEEDLTLVGAYNKSDLQDIESGPNQVEVSSSDNMIYFMQLGVFETFDNALALGGRLEKIGYTWAVNRLDERHYVISHIVGDREQLESVEKEMIEHDMTPFIKAVEVTSDELGWHYFLNAVNQIPYEMESSFIQSFTNDEMHIFGFFVALSNVSFDPLSSERQEMLLEIYHWLTN